MKRTIWTRIAQSVCAAAVAVAGTQAQAVIVLRDTGGGNVNAYELVTATQNWAGAKVNSQIAFPGAGSLPGSGVIGHLATITSANESAVVRGLSSGDPWIGLTDKAGDATGAFEGGNQSGFPVPAQGNTPIAGQRGHGWAWVTGEALTFHNWNGAGEPNGNTGENHVQLTGAGLWNDLNESSVRNYVREWDNVATASSLAMWKVQDIRTASTAANFVTLARSADPNVTTTTYHDTIDFNSAGGQFAVANPPFPQGGGDNFMTRSTAFIKIPTSGVYTINGEHDDDVFVEIGTNYGSVISLDGGAGGGNARQVFLTAGVYAVEVIHREGGGGDYVEFGMGLGTLANGNPALALVGSAGHPAGIQIHQSAAALGGLTPVSPQANIPAGWQVTVQTAAGSPGLLPGNEVNDLGEGLFLLANGGAPEATAVLPIINVTDNNFPAGTTEEHFAFYAKGFVDVLDNTSVNAALYVSSDDGFRLLVNGVIVSEFAGPTGNSDTISAMLNLKENDLIEIIFFEQGGGEFVNLSLDFDGLLATTGDRRFLGDPLGGIIIRQQPFVIPEPATALMGLMGVLAIGARRRRVA